MKATDSLCDQFLKKKKAIAYFVTKSQKLIRFQSFSMNNMKKVIQSLI